MTTLSTSLTRDEFNAACTALVAESDLLESHEMLYRGLKGWTVVASPVMANLRCLERTCAVPCDVNNDPIEDDDDIAELLDEEVDDAAMQPVPQAQTTQQLAVKQWVTYAPSFSVPAFYFACYDAKAGSPVPLDTIVRSSLLHCNLVKTTERTDHSLDIAGGSPFPLLSQGEHPVLGTPCWYLHPCETQTAISQLLQASDAPVTPALWLRTWLALISTAVDLRT